MIVRVFGRSVGRVGIALSALLGLAAIGAAGCSGDPSRGYSFESTYDASVSTVGVPIFANDTFETGVELELTEALIKRVQRDTPWRVIDAERADTTLSGRVVDFGLKTLSRRRGTGLVEEQLYELTVDFTWRDNRSGQTLVERRSFQASGAFVPDRLTGERIEVGRREAVGELARDIVAELRSGW